MLKKWKYLNIKIINVNEIIFFILFLSVLLDLIFMVSKERSSTSTFIFMFIFILYFQNLVLKIPSSKSILFLLFSTISQLFCL